MNPNQGGFPFGQPAGSTFSFGQQPGTQQTGGMPFQQTAQSPNTAIVNPLASGGFNFASPKTTQASFASPSTAPPPAGGFSFSSATTNTAPPAGISFGSPPAYSQGVATNTGFTMGQPPAMTSPAVPNIGGAFSFGKPAAPPPFGQVQSPQTAVIAAQPTTGFPFNQPAATSSATGGFGFGQSAASTTISGGFNMVGASTGGPFGLGNAPAATSGTGGFNLGSAAAPTTGGFSLGSAAAPTTGGFNLGSAAAPTTGGFNLGSAAAPTTGGFNMGGGATAQVGLGGFGAAINSNPATTFGLPGATSATPGGINFPSTSTSTGGLGFAASSVAPTGGFSFGSIAASAAQPGGFGYTVATPAAPAAFNISTPASTGGLGAGGMSVAASSTGFSLGGASTQAPFSIAATATPSLGGGFSLAGPSLPFTGGLGITAPATGMNFSNPASSMTIGSGQQAVTATSSVGLTSTTGGFSLGASAATPATSFTLGQPLASTGGGFSLPGATPSISATGPPTAVSTTGFSLAPLPASSTTAGFTLGQAVSASGGLPFPTGTTPSSGSILGSTAAPALGSTSIAPATSGFSFGSQLSTSKPAGLTLGATPTATSTTGVFGTHTSSGFTLGQPAVTSSAGLGGAATTVTGLGGAQAPAVDTDKDSTKPDGKSIRETALPTDIFATIETFETYKDGEKKASEENARQSATPFHKLGEDAKKLKQHILKLSNQHAHLHNSATKLKSLVVQDALNVEMARRTQDTPMNLQGENKSPEEFFLKMVRSFEVRMASCRNKIEEVEKGCTFKEGMSEATPEAIMSVLKREHRAVKMMAAQVYTLHNKLIDVYQKCDSKAHPKPELLFRTSSPEKPDIMSIANMESSVLRPCLDITSGLMEFQYGQQKAKSLSLAAAPPNHGLGQSGSTFLTPQSQSNIFNNSVMASPTSSNVGIQNANNSSFNFGKRPFGSANSSFSSPFSLPQQTSGGLFGSTGNNSSFGVIGK